MLYLEKFGILELSGMHLMLKSLISTTELISEVSEHFGIIKREKAGNPPHLSLKLQTE